MGSTLARPNSFKFDIQISDPDTSEPKDKITKIEIVKDHGEVVQSYTPDTPDYKVSWSPSITDSTSKYFFPEIEQRYPFDLAKAQMALTARMKEFPQWGGVSLTITPFSPVIDGQVLPRSPWRALLAGAAAEVELLTGHNRDEYRHPHVAGHDRDAYRQAFRAGYDRGTDHLMHDHH